MSKTIDANGEYTYSPETFNPYSYGDPKPTGTTHTYINGKKPGLAPGRCAACAEVEAWNEAQRDGPQVPTELEEKLRAWLLMKDDELQEALATPAELAASEEVDGTNPKDKFGLQKVSLSKVPAAAVAWCAKAFMAGARKYGPYNWRTKKVIASIYVDAAKRHIDEWFEGEELSQDDRVHHLGHAMACLAIIIDAQTNNCLKDDRPIPTDLPGLYAKLNEKSDPKA